MSFNVSSVKNTLSNTGNKISNSLTEKKDSVINFLGAQKKEAENDPGYKKFIEGQKIVNDPKLVDKRVEQSFK